MMIYAQVWNHGERIRRSRRRTIELGEHGSGITSTRCGSTPIPARGHLLPSFAFGGGAPSNWCGSRSILAARSRLFTEPMRGQPYFATAAEVADCPDGSPMDVNVRCERGIPFHLRLTGGQKGELVKARVSYWPIYPNHKVRRVPRLAPFGWTEPHSVAYEESAGSYVGVLLPGPGAITVAADGELYRPACVDPRARFRGSAVPAPGDSQLIFTTARLPGSLEEGVPVALYQSQFSAIVLVNPAEKDGPLNLDVALERDVKRKGTVLGPDD